jgi:hypothetical protein
MCSVKIWPCVVYCMNGCARCKRSGSIQPCGNWLHVEVVMLLCYFAGVDGLGGIAALRR